jgi:hypothetical protein
VCKNAPSLEGFNNKRRVRCEALEAHGDNIGDAGSERIRAGEPSTHRTHGAEADNDGSKEHDVRFPMLNSEISSQ